MRSGAVGVLAVASIVMGCYTPSFRDCELRCAAGQCPSGFRCADGVCRPDETSGACPMPADDGGMDAMDDAEVQTFCTLQTSARFCQDFDREPLPQQGWENQILVAGGTIQLVDMAVSTPSALQSQTPVTGTEHAEARLAKTFMPPPAWQNVTVAFDMQVAQRDMPMGPTGVFTVRTGAFVVDVTSNDANSLHFLLNQNPTTLVSVPSPIGTWRRIEIRIERVGTSASVSVYINNMAVDIIDAAPVPTNLPIELYPGLSGNFANGVIRVLFDNMVATAM